MNTSKTIRKILFIALWVAIGGGMLTLLIAAMGRQRREICKDYSISIKSPGNGDLFLGQADVLKLLKLATNGKIKGQPKSSFNLRQMEQLLEDNNWVKDAQLYFDNKNILHVSVMEREPVARVFTAGGQSFYIDDSGQRMPLSNRMSIKIPVFTGFPDKKMPARKDSIILHDIRTTAEFISGDPFWTSQVEQVDIDGSCGAGCWEFNMIPVVGNHLVKLGTGDDIEKKFSRLFIFYKQVLSKSGFDKYKTIDVRYTGQVVAGKSENPKVDAEQLRKNVDRLLQQIKEAEMRNEAQEQAAISNPAPANTRSDKPAALNMDTGTEVTPPEDNVDPGPAGKPATQSAARPATSGKAKDKEKPKAVMKKRDA